jgi:hypothetical protein
MRVQSLLINSSARINPAGSTTSNFRVNVSPCIPNVVATRLSQAVIENGYYFPTLVGVITLTIASGSPQTLTIPTGYYDDAGLCILLTTLFNQANPPSTGGDPQSTFFVQINPEGFLQIINDTTSSWTVSFDAISASVLSFTPSTPLTPTGANQPFIVQNNQPIRIPNTTYLFLQSEALGNTIYDSLGFASFKSLVSGTSNTLKGNDVLYENPIPFDPSIRVFRDMRTIDQVDITLKDIYGDAVRINTNNNMILVVELLIDDV